MPFKSSMSPVGCSTPKRASSQENSIVFPDIRTESPIAMAVSTPSPKPTPYRRSRTKSMDADFSLFPSLFKDKEAKLISRNNSRKNISAPKMKNLNRVISVLEEEFYPTDREIAQEHEITHLLKSESGGLLDTMETETKPSKRFWESTTFNPPSSPTYLPSRLNPESDCFYIEATPSPTSSCTSCSSLNPFNPGHRSPAGLRSKRKVAEERFEPYSSLKRRAVSPTVNNIAPPNAAARAQSRPNSLINIQSTSTSFSQMSLS